MRSKGCAINADCGRTASTSAQQVVKTNLALEGDAAVCLYSALAAVDLAVPAASGPWRFWFRDVPATAATAATAPIAFQFRRSQLPPSTQRRGSNDPSAISRVSVHRTGYEWRLNSPPKSTASQSTTATEPEDVALPLGPLWFCPLELAAMSFAADDTVAGIEIVGLLQLPPNGKKADAPRPELGNAVRLVFARPTGGGALQLARSR